MIDAAKKSVDWVEIDSNSQETIDSIIGCNNYAELFITVSDWVFTLNGIEDFFKKLQKSTEEELLFIGSQLSDFHSSSSIISDLSLQTANLLAGDHINNASDGLKNILDDFRDFLGNSEKELDDYISLVRRTLDLIDGVQKPISKFKKIVKHLRILGISIKIENSRLIESDTDFNALAEHVSKLSNQINSKYMFIREKLKIILKILNKNFSELLSLSSDQRTKAETVLQKSRDSMDSIIKKHQASSEAAAEILQRSEKIYMDIGEIVVSMQYHDITRQQMDHVNEVLKGCSEKLITHFDAMIYKDYEGIKSQIEKIHEVENILVLQKKQLLHSRDELLTAITGIFENLSNVKSETTGLAKSVNDLAGINSPDDESFLLSIKDGLRLIVEALTEISDLGKELSDTMHLLAENIQEISSFIKEIEIIGSEIELIALNAQVKAAHTGEGGAALGVLAEAIQKLSEEAFEITEEALNIFRSIVSNADQFEEKINKEQLEMNTSVKMKFMISTFEDLINSIQTIDDNVVTNLGKLEQNVQSLSEEIDAIIRKTTVKETVNSRIDQIASRIDSIINDCRSKVDESKISIDPIDLNKLERLYTMSSERQIHNSYIQKIAPDAEEGKQLTEVELFTEEAEPGKDELGDNVELF